MIDQSREFGARVARHLREESIVWLATVTPSDVGARGDDRRLVRATVSVPVRIRITAVHGS